MLSKCLFASVVTLFSIQAEAATSMYSDLYGKTCKVIEHDKLSGATVRRCAGVGGYSLLVREAHAQTSVDIVTPARAVYALDYWEVVTPGLAHVGRKAEWRVEQRAGRLVATGLLVRLDTSNPTVHGPRLAPGAILTAARIESDGACVVYQGNAAPRSADATARAAAANPRSKCLGVYGSD